MATQKPQFWNKICPSYKKLAQYFAILMIALFCWVIIYSLSPKIGSPKGQLCNFVGIIFMAYVGGTLLYKLTTLPPLIGMLAMGILLRNLGLVDIGGDFTYVTTELKRMSVVVTLTRLGLGLDHPMIKKSFIKVFKLGLVPWTVECITIAVSSHYLLNLPWNWSFLLSTIVSAVSPAVVVPRFKRLRKEGYGTNKGVTRLILASGSIDNITSITACCVLSSIMFNAMSPLILTILQGPIIIISAFIYGLLLGFILKYVPDKGDKFVVTLRVIILLFGCYAVSLAGSVIGYPMAGSLATVCTAFVVRYNWSKQGWEVEMNPVVKAFRILWIIFEPILFGLTGSQMQISELDPDTVLVGVGCIFASILTRFLATIAISFRNDYNTKEKMFNAMSWMGKGTLQAVLGSLALDFVSKKENANEELEYAKHIVMICTLSIVITAPLCATLISVSGSKLLTKSRTSEAKQTKAKNTKIKGITFPSNNEDIKKV